MEFFRFSPFSSSLRTMLTHTDIYISIRSAIESAKTGKCLTCAFLKYPNLRRDSVFCCNLKIVRIVEKTKTRCFSSMVHVFSFTSFKRFSIISVRWRVVRIPSLSLRFEHLDATTNDWKTIHHFGWQHDNTNICDIFHDNWIAFIRLKFDEIYS